MKSGPVEKLGVKVVVIGGGTGSFTLLNSLKNYAQHITALVNMADDGGSTGALRDELGVLPAGDVRQCLVALSESPKVRDLFNYRFTDGALQGHAFGNLFMAALEKMTGSFAEGVELASDILNVRGTVEPITLDKVTLVLQQSGGQITKGEYVIGHLDFQGQTKPELSLEPEARINPAAEEAIADADLIVVAPGNLYGSLAPALIVNGVSTALQSSRGKKIYVCNLVTKPGQTDGFMVHNYAEEIERFMGTNLDYVLYNDKKPSAELLEKYAHDKEFPVEWDDKALKDAHYKAIGGTYLASSIWENPDSAADPIAASRSLIRHDATAISKELMKIYFS
jgi:uncharacterized cofD-like protein